MKFSHVAMAMRPHWLAGAGPLQAMAEQLSTDYDSRMSVGELHKALEFMVVQCRDLCSYLHCWVADHSSCPGANAQDVLDDMIRLLHSLWRA